MQSTHWNSPLFLTACLYFRSYISVADSSPREIFCEDFCKRSDTDLMIEVKIDFSRVAETTLACVSLLQANYTRAIETGCPNKTPKIAGCSMDKWHEREREQKRLLANVFAVTKRGQPEYRRLDDDVLQRLFVSLTRNVEISLSISIGLDTATFHPTTRLSINSWQMYVDPLSFKINKWLKLLINGKKICMKFSFFYYVPKYLN